MYDKHFNMLSHLTTYNLLRNVVLYPFYKWGYWGLLQTTWKFQDDWELSKAECNREVQ